MSPPVLIISDTHYHNFVQYAQTTKEGINSRLADTIRATYEAAHALKKAGGTNIFHTGDVFHVRGNISPTVLNPVMEMYGKLVKAGFKVHMISGNHDLESNNADELTSTVTALREVGVEVYNEDTTVWCQGHTYRMIPWVNSLTDLRTKIRDTSRISTIGSHQQNLLIHAPLNGVIEGLPEHGLVPKDFDGMGYANVFVGHYHNHKRFATPDGKTNLFSVGALTHQNWGDVNAQAGYVIYHPDSGIVQQFETSAPKYMKVEFDDLDHPTLEVADCYVKVIGGEFEDPADVETVRNALILRGAKAVVVEGLSKRPAVTRTGTSSAHAPTIQTILGDYVDRNYPTEPDVKLVAMEILGEIYE